MSSLSALRSQIGKGTEIQKSHSSGGNINYLKPEHGTNQFRILPSLDGKSSFIYLRHVYGLDVEVTGEDGKKEIKQKKIFSSTTHGGTPKDIIEQYIEFVEKAVKDKLTTQNLSPAAFKESEKKWIAPLNDYKSGLKPEFKWCMYAIELKYGQGAQGMQEIKRMGPLEVSFIVGKHIDNIAASFDRPGAVINIDPFTDPNDGGILVIEYNSKATTPSDYYKTSLDTLTQRPISQEEMTWLKDQWSLQEQYQGSYRRADFNMALDGLQRFDTKHKYNAFSTPAFQQIVQEISKYYPEDPKIPMREHTLATSAGSPFDHVTQPQQGTGAVQQTEPVNQSGSSFNIGQPQQEAQSFEQAPIESRSPQMQMTPEQERQALISIITNEQLPITVHPNHTNEQINQFIEQERQLKNQQPADTQQPTNPPETSAGGSVADKVGGLF